MRRSTRWALGTVVALALCPAASLLAGGIVVVGMDLADNGDGDGFADTNETVELRLTVRNTTGAALTGVTGELTTDSPWTSCVSVGSIVIGDLAIDELRQTDPFVFTVGDVDRAALGLGPFDLLAAEFELSFGALPADPRAIPSRIAFDLDLDVSGGSGSAGYSESFEGSLGTFEIQNLDAGKHSLEASTGYRCHYANPDNPAGSCDPEACNSECFLGVSISQAATEYWDLSGPGFSSDGGRAFTGTHSLYFGFDLGLLEGFTIPMATLEAAATSDPIYLGWDGVTPILSFIHQASLADARTFDFLEPDSTYDRAVVMVQVADDQDDPAGPWIKVHPYQNPYAQTGRNDSIGPCTFDPVDDGNDEWDFFPGEQFLGPSATCSPGFAFANIGETAAAFDPANLGLADGPALQGQAGAGTWVESKFDLSRFRGRKIRLRFLATTLKIQFGGTYETYEEFFLSSASYPANPVPGDDGWWIDDVTVTGALTTPAVVVVDSKDNSALPSPPGADTDGDVLFDVCDNCALAHNTDQADRDLDGIGDACDLCPDEPTPIDDRDCDGVVDAVDNCVDVHNPGQGPSVALGESSGFAISPDGAWVVSGGQVIPTSGGSPIPFGGTPIVESQPFPPEVRLLITHDSSRIVYVSVGLLSDLAVFSVATGGGTPIRLSPEENDALICRLGPVCSALRLSADGSTVLYRDHFDGLFVVPITGGPAVDLGVGTPNDREISPDGSQVVFLDAAELKSVPSTGGVATLLDDGGSVSKYTISPDSSSVVYVCDTGGVLELCSVAIEGGAPITLNGAVTAGFSGAAEKPFEVSPDGSTVVYRIDEGSPTPRLLSVPIGGGASTVLDSNLVRDFTISPDGTTVFYTAVQGILGKPKLYRVPIGGGTPIALVDDFGSVGGVGEFEFDPDSDRVVYLANQETQGLIELYSVPASGGSSTKLNVVLASGENIVDFRIGGGGSTVAYRLFESGGADDLYSVSVTGGASTHYNGSLPLGIDQQFIDDVRRSGFGVEVGFAVAPDGTPYFLLAELGTALYRGSPDVDADGHLASCDVCPGLFDPGQEDDDGDGSGNLCDCAPADAGSFDSPGEVAGVLLDRGTTIAWSSQAPFSGAGTRYEVLRGGTTELPVGSGGSALCLDSALAVTTVTDTEVPASGIAYYYLVRGSNTCAIGTYGDDSVGAERISVACP